MTDFTRSYDVVINAPVPDVFAYCRDPRHLFEGWPELEVTSVVMTPEGVGTKAHITGRFLGGTIVEQVEREYTEFVPDHLIVSRARATVRVAGWTKDVTTSPVFTWRFEAQGAGTRLTIGVLEKDLGPWLNLLRETVGGAVMARKMRAMLAAIKTGVEVQLDFATPLAAVGQHFQLRNIGGEILFQFATLHTDVLTRRFGAQTARLIRREMLQEYRALVPGLPDIGGRSNPEWMSLVLAPWALALYRVVQRHGGSLEDAGETIHYAMKNLYGRIPQQLRVRMGRSVTKDRAEQKARWFAEHPYPDNWVYEVVDGEGQPFDFGLDATQCGIVNYLHTQAADELTPYLCDLDYVTFEASGIGLTRTKTLAWGCDRCDFRITNPGTTTSTWPPLFPERSCGLPQPLGTGAPTRS